MKKCAIYSRVSTSMQNEAEYSSCDAQKDRIMSYIKSQEDLEFTKEYSDPAFSGKDLERPSLQQLFKDIIQRYYPKENRCGFDLQNRQIHKVVKRLLFCD